MHFKVHGSGKNLFGDGFAVWYARDRNQLGKYDLRWNFLDKKTEFIRITFAHTVKYFFWLRFVGPVFGNKDFFVGLGIFMDTYSNHNGPHNVRLKTS